MPYPLDPVRNVALCTVGAGYNETAKTIVLAAGHGSKLPNPATEGAFNLNWWDGTTYAYPGSDPKFEIVRCTARTNDTLTITRAQEGTTAQTHNTPGKTYYMLLGFTKKMLDDIGAVFVVLDGKSGGQHLYGGIAAYENLYLSSTKHATKAKIYLGDYSYFDEASHNLYIQGGASSIIWIKGTSTARLRLEDTGGPADSKLCHIINDAGGLTISAINDDLTVKYNHIQLASSGMIYLPQVYNATVGGTNRDLYIDDSGKLGYVSSSLKNKTRIERIDLVLSAKLRSIRPVTFEYKNEPGLRQVGFIAEEVQSILPEAVGMDKEGNPVCVNHSKIVPFLVAEIIELRKEIEALKRT